MKILLLDIETAPNKVFVWGLWNQNVALNQIDEPGYTLCWSAKWLGEDSVMFSSIRDGRADMLARIYALVDQADVVVHYNGSKFDMPTLNQEWLSMGWTPPAPYAQIDLFLTVKKRFRFPSNKLSYISELLAIGAKVNHKGMELWRECMEGDDKAWEIMEKYNKQDVRLLENLYIKLKPWVVSHPNTALYTAVNEMVCPHCGSNHIHRRGFQFTKSQRYQRYRCEDCGSWSRSRYTDINKDERPNILVGV